MLCVRPGTCKTTRKIKDHCQDSSREKLNDYETFSLLCTIYVKPHMLNFTPMKNNVNVCLEIDNIKIIINFAVNDTVICKKIN